MQEEEAMVLKQLRTVRKGEEEEDLMPVSPTGQFFNSSVLSVTVLNIFESEIPIDDSQTMLLLQREFLPINPRFSSIMVKDEQGVMHWKKVKVNLEDHVAVAVFPAGLSPEDYEEHVQEYLSKIAMEPLPQNRPLWDLHLIKYPTTNAAGTLVYKLHHALGDGFSLMAALFSYVKRADDPSLPFTFPSSSSSGESKPEMSIYSRVCGCLSLLWNTAADFGFSMLKSNWLEDDRTPIRSAIDGVEFRPITISSVIFSLDRIRQVKSKLGGTVNDVICGIIFYGTQLYMQRDGKTAREARATALVLLNTRIIRGYKSLEEMTKADAESPWGNDFGFMHVPVPSCGGDAETADPLEFIVKASQTIKQKRSSLGVVLTGRLLEMLRKLRGREEAAKYIHATLRNTSMTISNMVGPLEKMVMADHPTKSFYFMVVGVPQVHKVKEISTQSSLKMKHTHSQSYIRIGSGRIGFQRGQSVSDPLPIDWPLCNPNRSVKLKNSDPIRRIGPDRRINGFFVLP